MKYVQNPEKFEAIQFTGGEKNAAEVLDWLKEKTNSISHSRWVPNLHLKDSEYIELGRGRIGVSMWMVFGTRSGLEYYDDEDFQKRFSPEEPTVAERNYETFVRETTGGSSEFHVDAPVFNGHDRIRQAAKDDSPKAPKYVAEVEAIQFMGGEKNLDFIGRWVFAGGGQVELHGQSKNNTEHLHLISIDGETSYTVVPGDWIIKDALGFSACHAEDFPKLFKEL